MSPAPAVPAGEKRHAAESLAPFLHPKLSTVELHPPGHPDGPPSILTLVAQDRSEIPNMAAEAVIEADNAGESGSEAAAAAPAVNSEDPAGQVADEIVKQALDAVVLLARDPRYAEAIRRQLSGVLKNDQDAGLD